MSKIETDFFDQYNKKICIGDKVRHIIYKNKEWIIGLDGDDFSIRLSLPNATLSFKLDKEKSKQLKII